MDQNNGIIIIGSGLAGLSAAFHGGDVIYEKDGQVGGMCQSPKIDGYTFDHGIHVLHTKDEYVLKLLKQDLKICLPPQTRNAWIYSYDALTRYPIQANTFGLPIPVVKKCLVEFIKVYNKQKDHFKDYEDWILNTFGEGFGRQFLIPYSNKFWTVQTKELTTEWIDVRIPRPSIEDVIEGALTDQEKGFGPNATFMYPEGDGGIGTLPVAFESALLALGKTITYNKEVCEVDVKGKKVMFTDNSSEDYSKLISTMPLPELIKVLKPTPPVEIMEAVGRLKHNSILCVNLGIKNININPNHWIYYIENRFAPFRISFLKNFSVKLVPNGKSSITAEIAYSGNSKFSKTDIVEKVTIDLVNTGIIKSVNDVEMRDVRDLKYGYVIYDHERTKSVKIIKKYLSESDIISAGRYGSWEYQWMDNAILDGKSAIEEALNCK